MGGLICTEGKTQFKLMYQTMTDKPLQVQWAAGINDNKRPSIFRLNNSSFVENILKGSCVYHVNKLSEILCM